jgi:hypothetical protein
MKIVVLFLMIIAAIPLSGQQETVSFNLDAPESVVAGSEFEVTLTFIKGDLKDYSRFSQDLPEGFTASNVVSPNADFTFSDQRIRIIWLKLPDEQEVEVKYAIDVHERLSGKLELTGTFAYVNMGERAYLNLPEPEVVNILPNPDIDQSLVVDISEFSTIGTSVDSVDPVTEAVAEEFAKVVRQEPVVGANGIVQVNLLVSNPLGSNYLKLEESIPGGYSFESVEANGAVVSQASSLARFVWMRPPTASVFTVKYRLVPILESNQDPLVIDGELTYTQDGESRVATARQVDVELTSLNTLQQTAFLKTGEVPDGLTQLATPDAGKAGSEKKESVDERSGEIVVRTDKPIAGAHSRRSSDVTKRAGPSVIDIPSLEKTNGVTFRVQVAAVRNPIFGRVIFADYELLRDVKVEKDNGWHKYTVGPLASYEDAVRLKNQVETETPVDEAFVIAYRDGTRVPVGTVR